MRIDPDARTIFEFDNDMDLIAQSIVADYIEDHVDATDSVPAYQIFAVWKSKVLQNWKYLISTSLPDGMYYELTYNGDKDEWYFDAYKKFENRVIKHCDAYKKFENTVID